MKFIPLFLGLIIFFSPSSNISATSIPIFLYFGSNSIYALYIPVDHFLIFSGSITISLSILTSTYGSKIDELNIWKMISSKT